jgi:hypothetical protein
MQWRLLLLLLTLLSACERVPPLPPPPPPELALSEIDAPQLAAQYLATQLTLLGFAPGAADGTYFQ